MIKLNMDMKTATELLGNEWVVEGGFFGDLRIGEFDKEALKRVLDILRSVQVADVDYFSKEFIAVIWFIPIFLEWQKPRVIARGGQEEDVDEAINTIMPLLYEILGMP